MNKKNKVQEIYFLFAYFFGFTPEEVDKMKMEDVISFLDNILKYKNELNRLMPNGRIRA